MRRRKRILYEAVFGFGAVARLKPDSAELQTLGLTERGGHEVV
jgi:hypothetical protein